MKNNKIYFIAQSAIIAAIYVVLTFIANALGLANYAVQLRFSEAMTILPLFTTASIPGLTLGCLLSNILTGCALPDIIFGSLATLLGALGTRALRNFSPFLAPLPPILANTIIVPFILKYAYGIEPLWLSFITVGLGEILSCGVLGLILYFTLKKKASNIFREP